MTGPARFWWDEAETVPEQLVQDAADRLLEVQLEAAAQDVQRANEAYDRALVRVRLAPQGETRNRRSELRTANFRVLMAEVRLAELRRDGPL